jgi:hypothetical protein
MKNIKKRKKNLWRDKNEDQDIFKGKGRRALKIEAF